MQEPNDVNDEARVETDELEPLVLAHVTEATGDMEFPAPGDWDNITWGHEV